MIWQTLHIRIWQVSAILLLISSHLKFCQVGWGHFKFLQKCLIAFKPRLWLGHSRTFTELSISHSCCVLRVTVLLEGKPSAQSEVLNALDWVFINAISIFWCIELIFYSDESLSPCCWKQTQSMRLLPAHFTFGMVWYSACGEQNWLPSNMLFGIEVHQTRKSSFSQSEGPLGAFLQIPSVFICLHRGEDCIQPHQH